MKSIQIFFGVTVLSALVASALCDPEAAPRRERTFSLFNIVKFKNDPCVTNEDSLGGTCYTASECTAAGGTAKGDCAAGFGVCCLFIKKTCGDTVTKNCTYIENPEYPSSRSTASTSCAFTFGRSDYSDICQIRLDFEKLVTSVSTGASTSGRCQASDAAHDSVVVTSPAYSNANAFKPLCGTLTGQHIYIETGRKTSGNYGTVTFNTGTSTATQRSWKAKVSYIDCANRAPQGCLQWYTEGVTGIVKSLNYDGRTLLDSIQYTQCIRQELGYCSIQFAENPTVPSGRTAFFLTGTAGGASSRGTACTATITSRVILPTKKAASCAIAANCASEYCGGTLSTMNADTTAGVVTSGPNQPFQIRTTTVQAAAIEYQEADSGYNLVYTQVPC